MATIATTVKRSSIGNKQVLQEHVGTSAANSADTLTTSTTQATDKASQPKRVLGVTVKYSAAVTLSVTIGLDSGRGAGYDTDFAVAALNAARSVFWQPDSELWLAEDDAIVVTVPAGGAGVTAAIVVYFVSEDGF